MEEIKDKLKDLVENAMIPEVEEYGPHVGGQTRESSLVHNR